MSPEQYAARAAASAHNVLDTIWLAWRGQMKYWQRPITLSRKQVDYLVKHPRKLDEELVRIGEFNKRRRQELTTLRAAIAAHKAVDNVSV